MKFHMDEISDINFENVQALIDNYEKFIRELTAELDSFKSEHDVIKTKVSVLIEENNRISKEYKNLLKEKENPIACNINVENKIVDNLKKQLDATLNEKECTMKMWQDAIQTIDTLEDELKMYQAGTQEYVPKKEVFKIKAHYENSIKSLETKLLSSQEKLVRLTETSSKELNMKSSDIEKSLENQTSILKIIKNLEDEILSLQERLQSSVDIRTDIEKKLKFKEKILESFKNKNHEYRAKVQEAVQVVEAALNEKDAALSREQKAREEIEKMSQTISEILNETKDKVKNEIVVVKNECNEKLKRMLDDLKVCQQEITGKTKEVEKYASKCSILENEIQRIQKGNLYIEDSSTSKLLLLEKNLESTFQKLLLSEKQNIQLTSQMECTKNDMEQMASHYERVLRTKEIEKTTLESKITHMKNQLDDGNIIACESSEKVAMLRDKIENLQKSYEEQLDNSEKIKTMYIDQIEKLNITHNESLKNCKEQLECQILLNNKWRKETKIITDNLEKLITNLKVETHKLRKENTQLKASLQEIEHKNVEYKIFLNMLSKDVQKLTSLTLSSGNQS